MKGLRPFVGIGKQRLGGRVPGWLSRSRILVAALRPLWSPVRSTLAQVILARHSVSMACLLPWRGLVGRAGASLASSVGYVYRIRRRPGEGLSAGVRARHPAWSPRAAAPVEILPGQEAVREEQPPFGPVAETAPPDVPASLVEDRAAVEATPAGLGPPEQPWPDVPQEAPGVGEPLDLPRQPFSPRVPLGIRPLISASTLVSRMSLGRGAVPGLTLARPLAEVALVHPGRGAARALPSIGAVPYPLAKGMSPGPGITVQRPSGAGLARSPWSMAARPRPSPGARGATGLPPVAGPGTGQEIGRQPDERAGTVAAAPEAGMVPTGVGGTVEPPGGMPPGATPSPGPEPMAGMPPAGGEAPAATPTPLSWVGIPRQVRQGEPLGWLRQIGMVARPALAFVARLSVSRAGGIPLGTAGPMRRAPPPTSESGAMPWGVVPRDLAHPLGVPIVALRGVQEARVARSPVFGAAERGRGAAEAATTGPLSQLGLGDSLGGVSPPGPPSTHGIGGEGLSAEAAVPAAPSQREWPVLGWIGPRAVQEPGREPAALAFLRRRRPEQARAARRAIESLPALGPGEPLTPTVRQPMEAILGRGFGGVRLYTSPLAQELGAEALTTGERIVFAPGRMDLRSPRGLALLGHELTHVGQALAFKPSPATGPDSTDDEETAASSQEALVQRIIEQGWPNAPRMEMRRATRALAALTETAGLTGGPAMGEPSAAVPVPPSEGAAAGSAAATPGQGPKGAEPARAAFGRIRETAPGEEATADQVPTPDLDHLARQVYAILKARLRAERDRHQLYSH